MNLDDHKLQTVKDSLKRLDETDHRILRYCLIRGIANRKELGNEVGGDLGAADASISKLVEEGLIVVKNKEPKGPLTWEINGQFKDQIASEV